MVVGTISSKSAALLLFVVAQCTSAFHVQGPVRAIVSGLSPSRAHVHARTEPSTSALPSSKTMVRMVSYEDLMERLPSKAVIESVDESPTGKVIASDVAASAGVSLAEARKDLTALASLTRGDIAVSSDGELIYSFPSNIGGVLASNSAKYQALAFFEKIWPGLFYAIRVSFGIVLLASLFAIFSTIFFISQGGSSDDDRRRDDRGFGGDRGMRMGGGFYDPFWGPSPFDFFYYRPYYGYYGGPGQPARDPDEMGFLESTFSYIFGDGNPNTGLEEKRLSLVANMIRENDGAVTAEQLAPFCDDAPSPAVGSESTYVDESFVLPIVTKLNGDPRVTEDGDIIYVFPELQLSATSTTVTGSNSAMVLKRAGLESDATTTDIKRLLTMNGISSRGALEKKDLLAILEKVLPPLTEKEEAELLLDDPTVLQEREYEFSLASSTQKFLAGALGVVNLGGALYLGNMFSSYALYGVQLPSYFGVVQSLYPFLLGYAVLFNVIPLARSFWINSENQKIRQRNAVRRSWRSQLEGSVGKIARKLRAATSMGTRMKRLGSSDADIIFDTSTSFEKNKEKRERDVLAEFDQLLEKNDE